MTPFTPPPPRALPEHRRAAMRHQLTAVVTGGHRRRRPLIIAASAVVIAAGTSAGAYAYVQHSQPVTDKYEVICFTVPSLSAGLGSSQIIGESITHVAGGSGLTHVANAVGVCASLWRDGSLHLGPRGVHDGPGIGKVPPLVACVLPGGTAGVFPGSRATCAALGLPNAASH